MERLFQIGRVVYLIFCCAIEYPAVRILRGIIYLCGILWFGIETGLCFDLVSSMLMMMVWVCFLMVDHDLTEYICIPAYEMLEEMMEEAK